MSERQTKAGNLANLQTCKLALSHHSRHAEPVLFSSLCSKVAVYRRKCFFLDLSTSTTLTCYIRVHRAVSQLKIKPVVTNRSLYFIFYFDFKQPFSRANIYRRLLNYQMKDNAQSYHFNSKIIFEG